MHASVMNLHTNYSERPLQKQCKTGGNQYTTTITVLQKSGINEQQLHKKIITRKSVQH